MLLRNLTTILLWCCLCLPLSKSAFEPPRSVLIGEVATSRLPTENEDKRERFKPAISPIMRYWLTARGAIATSEWSMPHVAILESRMTYELEYRLVKGYLARMVMIVDLTESRRYGYGRDWTTLVEKQNRLICLRVIENSVAKDRVMLGSWQSPDAAPGQVSVGPLISYWITSPNLWQNRSPSQYVSQFAIASLALGADGLAIALSVALRSDADLTAKSLMLEELSIICGSSEQFLQCVSCAFETAGIELRTLLLDAVDRHVIISSQTQAEIAKLLTLFLEQMGMVGSCEGVIVRSPIGIATPGGVASRLLSRFCSASESLRIELEPTLLWLVENPSIPQFVADKILEFFVRTCQGSVELEELIRHSLVSSQKLAPLLLDKIICMTMEVFDEKLRNDVISALTRYCDETGGLFDPLAIFAISSERTSQAWLLARKIICGNLFRYLAESESVLDLCALLRAMAQWQNECAQDDTILFALSRLADEKVTVDSALAFAMLVSLVGFSDAIGRLKDSEVKVLIRSYWIDDTSSLMRPPESQMKHDVNRDQQNRAGRLLAIASILGARKSGDSRLVPLIRSLATMRVSRSDIVQDRVLSWKHLATVCDIFGRKDVLRSVCSTIDDPVSLDGEWASAEWVSESSSIDSRLDEHAVKSWTSSQRSYLCQAVRECGNGCSVVGVSSDVAGNWGVVCRRVRSGGVGRIDSSYVIRRDNVSMAGWVIDRGGVRAIPIDLDGATSFLIVNSAGVPVECITAPNW